MSLPATSRNQVENLASEVLKKHGLNSIPINPVVLAQKEGFMVNNAKFSDDSLSGMIAKKGENLMILVRAEDSPNRKRFTIAHELGHHFLHLLKDGEFVDRESDMFREDFRVQEQAAKESYRSEWEANWFAAALLMPADQVHYFWKTIKSIATLAEHFGVSEEAMGYRLDKLGLSLDD